MQKTINKYLYLFVVQGDYGHGWEDLTCSHVEKAARANFRDYEENETRSHRLIQRRVAL